MADDSDMSGFPDKKENPQDQKQPSNRQVEPSVPAENGQKRQRPDRRPENRRFGGQNPMEGRRHGQPGENRQGTGPRKGRGSLQRQKTGVLEKHEKPEKVEKPKNTVTYTCAICGKPIFDLASALGNRGTGEPVHFDCVLEALSSEEKLAENEKLIYLGAGFFAVVVYKNGKDGAFTVSRKIRWEDENNKSSWRKDLSSSISNL
jgi:hypothetical protein